MNNIGVSNMAYVLPKKKHRIENLSKEGKLESSVEQLRSMGFEFARVAEEETSYSLAKKACLKLLKESNCQGEQIDVLIYSGALASSINISTKNKSDLSIFQYSLSKLQYDLNMTTTNTLGIAQQGCVSLFSSLWVADSILKSDESVNLILCVSSDVLPKENSREIIYNLISDGACAVLVSRNSQTNKILSYSQISKGYYWDSALRKNELIASYFPTAKIAIEKALKKAKLNLKDIDWIIPHNVSLKSWQMLLNILEFPKERLFSENISKLGHTIAADNIINLKDATEKGYLRKGQKILLFSFGLGAYWSCLILEH